MAKINTQPISDAHNKIFDSVISGLGRTKTRLVELADKASDRTSSVPVVKTVLKPSTIESGFTQLEKGLTKQHDFVEDLLAKTR